MKFTPQQREQYKIRFLALAKMAEVKNGRWNFIPLSDANRPLYSEMAKHRGLRSAVTETEVFFAVLDSLYTLVGRPSSEDNFLLMEKITPEDMDQAANKFVDLFGGLPYEHYYYFQIPMRLPEKLHSISITENFEITLPAKTEPELAPPISELARALVGKSAITEGDVFCRVRVFGYGAAALASATASIKQFLYLTTMSGLFFSSPWKKTISIEKNCYRAPNLKDGKRESFSSSNELDRYMAGLDLNQQRFEGFVPGTKSSTPLAMMGSLMGAFPSFEKFEDFYSYKFIEGCAYYRQLHEETYRQHRDHIFSAIEWGFDGSANPNETMGFIQTCIGLEALLGDKETRPEKSDRGLTEMLADRCAYLLAKTPDQRKEQSESFREIYDLRSKLVHGVRPKVTEEQQRVVSNSRTLLNKLVLKELNLTGPFGHFA